MTSTADKASAALDRLLIRETFERYLFSTDSFDGDGVAACFTPDGFFWPQSNVPGTAGLTGRAAIASSGNAGLPKLGRVMNHALSSIVIEVDGDRATSTAFCVSHIATGEETGGTILIRGIRYDDEWQNLDGEWLISKRMHQGQWQGNVASVLPRLPGR